MIFGSISNGWQLLVILAILLTITVRKFFKSWGEYRRHHEWLKRKENREQEDGKTVTTHSMKVVQGNKGLSKYNSNHVPKNKKTVMRQ